MSNINFESLSSQMKVMADMAAGQLNAPGALPASGESDFESLLKKAVQGVNDKQNVSQANMTLEEVMVDLQKANLSFQTMIAVRNRLVDAYKEVTNLQV